MYKKELSANGTSFGSVAFTCSQCLNTRLNTKLESNGYAPMSSLIKDLSDGVKLIQLMVRPNIIHACYPHRYKDIGNHGYAQRRCTVLEFF